MRFRMENIPCIFSLFSDVITKVHNIFVPGNTVKTFRKKHGDFIFSAAHSFVGLDTLTLIRMACFGPKAYVTLHL